MTAVWVGIAIVAFFVGFGLGFVIGAPKHEPWRPGKDEVAY